MRLRQPAASTATLTNAPLVFSITARKENLSAFNISIDPFQVVGKAVFDRDLHDLGQFVAVIFTQGTLHLRVTGCRGFNQQQAFLRVFQFALPGIRLAISTICTQAASRRSTNKSARRPASARLPAAHVTTQYFDFIALYKFLIFKYTSFKSAGYNACQDFLKRKTDPISEIYSRRKSS